MAVAQPYRFFCDPTEERHRRWLTTAEKPIAVVICPVGESADCFEQPLFSYLLEAEACRYGMAISFYKNIELEYELSLDLKPLEGHPCQLLQV
ncbi:hypothetical protein SH661x_002830 [Planctomicrobium sp. SH661]|uniref:hypothetical protein n=1 Tax=Planctomicrobium sp. SH661 TaxID=3448124 RepID=UPI003F5C6DA7